MSWFYEDLTGHEGYAVAVVEGARPGEWRDASEPTPNVRCVQAVCTCGWRSPRRRVAWGTRWHEGMSWSDETDELRTCDEWEQHCQDESQRPAR